MNNNEIKIAIEDAWREFERTGEIANGADLLLSAVSALQEENDNLKTHLENLSADDEHYLCG
jgi:hypothetical protein